MRAQTGTAAKAEAMESASLADFKPLPQGGDQYPLEYIENNSVVKLKENDELIQIGVCDPADEALLQTLRNFHGKQVAFFSIDKSELAGYLGERLSEVDTARSRAADDEKLLLDKLANDAPVINLVNSLLIEAIRLEASDIHVECFSERMLVRYRLDGALQTVRQLDKDSFPAVASRLKIMANLNIMERRLPQDGRITVHLGGDVVDMRMSVVPISSGESIVLRLFNKKRAPLTVEQLGLSGEGQELLRRLARSPNGLILVTGPTGSGKTTSLNALLQEIKSESQKIITIEDPIEYVIDGVDQIQTNERIGLTFDSLLRRILRQDPNIIMVGEIRDSPTAELAIRAALTGHLVLSTLHTRDSVSVITRLKNMEIEPYLIAAVLKGSVAQRLVRHICPACSRPVKPTAYQREQLERGGLAADRLYEGAGCKACHQTGFRGRIGVFELFASDEEVEEMIIAGRRDADIRAYLEGRGMVPLIGDGLAKVCEGVTTLAEVERAVLG